MKKLLRQLDPDKHPSAFDRIVAYDAPPEGTGETAENEEGFFVSSRDSAMREKGALNEAARRRMPRSPAMGNDRPR